MEINIKPKGKLYEKGQVLIDAAYEYWKEYQKVSGSVAVIWLKDSRGRMVLFTRGEYSDQIMRNIEPLRDEEGFDDS